MAESTYTDSGVTAIGDTESQTSNCDCIVCFLQDHQFSTLPVADKLAIVLENNRPKPNMKNLTTRNKTCTRHFVAEKTYDQYEWLTGCENRNKLFCWPCILFVSDKGVWNKSGFSDLNNLHKVVKRHITSKGHLEAVIKESVFAQARLKDSIDKTIEIDHNQHNQLVNKNRNMLKSLIDVLCFLVQHKLALSNSTEEIAPANKQNFQDLVSLLAKYDIGLKNHLELSNVLRATPNCIQNDLISATKTIVLNRIKSEIKQARFMAMVLDETTYETNLTHLSIVIRYPKSDGSIQERFLGLKVLTGDRTADSLYKIVLGIIGDFDGDVKLIAQSYGGALVKEARHLQHLKARVQETFSSAQLVHYPAHRLNIILSESLKHIKKCKLFFVTLSGMAAFFSSSTKRAQAFDLVANKRLSRGPVATQWNYNGRLVLTIIEHRESLIKLFENMKNNENWDAGTIISSRGFLETLKRDFNFNFLLFTFAEIFPISDNVFNILSGEIGDIGFCVKKINEFKYIVNKKKREFHLVWKKTVELGVIPQYNAGDIHITYRRLFNEIIEEILQQIDCRFENLNDLKFLELRHFGAFKGKPFPEEAFVSLFNYYGHYFNKTTLRTELSVIYETDDIDKKWKSNANELLIFLKRTNLDNAYFEVSKLCELILTIPIPSATIDQNFSKLERIEGFVRNATEHEKLSDISILSIENDLVQAMSEIPPFYEDIIDEYAKNCKGIIELQYKSQTDSASATATSNTRLELPIQGPSGQGAEPSDPFLELPSTSNRPVNKRRRQNTDSYEDDSTTDSSKPIQMPIDDVVGLTDVKCELDENMSDSDSLMEIVKHEIEDYIPDVPDSVSPQEIEAILINDDDDDVDTESPQNIKLIKTKEEPEKNHFDDRHPVDVFCKSVALSLKSLRSDLCNEGKIRIMQLISELEQRNALPNENPSTSRTINNRAEPTSTVTRNLILKKELD